jgi:hypothetical protein
VLAKVPMVLRCLRDCHHQGLCTRVPMLRVWRPRGACQLCKPQYLVYCRLRGPAAVCCRLQLTKPIMPASQACTLAKCQSFCWRHCFSTLSSAIESGI